MNIKEIYKAEMIGFEGVYFTDETVKILSPEKKVFIPDIFALTEVITTH